ncbi:MAG: ergothioneine biosynthesis protein EgtB, partial [Burkholderiaceae bacterium]
MDCLEHIDQSREQVPHLEILNPPLWELGHIGWFHEFWCLRDGDFTQASTLPGADDLFNSTDVIHARRWTLPLHSMQATRAYLSRVFDLAAERLDQCDGSEQAMYFHRLSHFHEAMHLEAFCYSWQTVGYPRPSMLAPIPLLKSKAVDIEIAACSVRLGSDPSDGFCFDNEKWGLD